MKEFTDEQWADMADADGISVEYLKLYFVLNKAFNVLNSNQTPVNEELCNPFVQPIRHELSDTEDN